MSVRGMSDIQKALERATAAGAATQPKTKPSVAPSRQGRVHIGAYLPADFKRGIRMLQATTGEDLQSILARVLNEQFTLHNLPVVDQD